MAQTYASFAQFPWQEYLKANPGLQAGPQQTAEAEGQRAWQDYLKKGGTWSASGAAPAPTQQTGATNAAQATQITPGKPAGATQMNIADYAGQVAANPSVGMSPSMTLSDNVPQINAAQQKAGEISTTATQGGATSKYNQTATQAAQVAPKQAQTYDATKTQQAVANQDMTAAQGQVRDEAKINASDLEIDTAATAAGDTPTGQALKEFASLDLEDVNPKATTKGQLEQLQADFQNPDGTPKIPVYAQGIARSVGRIASFTGMTGTAATAAMATALMESSIQVATQDAQFFQTLTLKNLDNEQQATINRASVLANMELANVDARTAAAIQNSKNFMDMDLANLSNEQQARVINNQNRVQSILTDANAENAAKAFNAQSKNEMTQFYDQLGSSISMFNATQTNNMKQFNASLENNREQFYKNMQFQVDVANAQWRQNVTLTNNQNKFEAAALDVKNAVSISQEALNQLWDRSDAMLDYIWKSSENQLDRDAALATAKLQAKSAEKAATTEGIGSVVGSVAGALVGKLDIF